MTSPLPDQSRTPSLLLLFRAALRRADGERHTGLPGRVESYDPVKQLADVQPLVMYLAQQEDGTLVAEQLPVLAGIPVHFRAGGGMRETWPLKQGDTGWIKFSEASLDAWQAQGGIVNPGDPRRFSIADAVFEPGLHANDKPFSHANANDYSVGNDNGPQLVITPATVELGGTSDDRPTEAIPLGTTYRQNEDTWFQALASRLATLATALTATGAALSSAGTDTTLAGLASTAAGFLNTAGIALTNEGTDLAQIASDLSNFSANAAKFLSTISKTK